MTASVAEEMAVLLAENRQLADEVERMREALEEIALRTIQRDLSYLARAALGQKPNPYTARLREELGRETR